MCFVFRAVVSLSFVRLFIYSGCFVGLVLCYKKKKNFKTSNRTILRIIKSRNERMMMFDVNVDCDDDNDTVVAENVTHSGIDERPDVWEPITVMLELHPTYLHIFKQSIVSMFYGDGPLPYHHRHYLAIMVSELRLL